MTATDTNNGGRATSTNGGQDGAIDLLAGLIVDADEELPTSKRGRQAEPVDPAFAGVFTKLVNGEARALIWPPKGSDADPEMVNALVKQATKWFKTDGANSGKRPSYATAATSKDGKRSRVCLTVVSKN